MPKGKITFESIGENFFRIESKESLYTWEIAGVQVWTQIRSKLLPQLAKDAGVYDFSNAKKHRPPEDYVGYQGKKPTPELLKYLTGWRWHLRAVLPKPTDPRVRQWLAATELVVPFSSRGPAGEEPLSAPIIRALGENALVLGRGAWDHKSDRPHLEILQIEARAKYQKLFAVLAVLSIRKSDRAKWGRIIRSLESAAGAKLSKYRAFPTWTIYNYLSEARLYKRIFKRLPIRHLFIVNATAMNLVGALQEIGVPTIELQNGLFGKYGLQFSWPGRPSIKYLPTEIWTWGDFWTEGIENSSNQTVRVVGSNESFQNALVNQASGAKNWQRCPGRVTVMSQPIHTAKLFRAAEKIAKANPEMDVIFKPHPRDKIESFKEKFRAGTLPKNLRMAKPEEDSLTLCSTSETVVGVFSTALVEALGLGAKVGILKLSGWESLERLVTGGYAKAFDTTEELAEQLASLPKPADPKHFYAPQVDFEAELAALKERTA